MLRLAIAFAATGLIAQATTSQLQSPAATVNAEFTMVTSVRELSDERVLVVDERENKLFVADFVADRVTPIGRVGDGPGEYRRVGRLWPLRGDSTLMIDPLSQRQLIFAGAKVVSTRPRAGGPTESGLAYGVDHERNTLRIVHSMRNGKLTGLRDSMFVIRGRPGGRVDTIARVPSEYANIDPTKRPATLQGFGRGTKRVYRATIADLDQAVLFPDGWVAVARTRPYRVDWCAPKTACAVGPTIAADHTPITLADKRAYIASMVASEGWPEGISPDSVLGWPASIPAFTARQTLVDASPLLALPDGRLLIERLPTAAMPGRRYDIIDRRGNLASQLTLAANQRIVGVSATYLYVTTTDENDLQRLERRPWR